MIKKFVTLFLMLFCIPIFIHTDENKPVKVTNTESSYPFWSPDGSKIVFQSNRAGGDSEIYIMNADGTNQTNLTQNYTAKDIHPYWSPDGSKIIFNSSRKNDICGIYMMNPDGTQLRRIAGNGIDDYTHARISPTGKKIILRKLIKSENWKSDIFIMDINGNNEIRLTRTPGFNGYPSWSPHGTHVVFSSTENPENNQDADIYIMRPDGTGIKKIADMISIKLTKCSWSGDGKKIIFTGSSEGSEDIYLLNTNNNDSNAEYYQDIAESIYEISSLYELNGRWKDAVYLLNKGIEIMRIGENRRGRAQLQGLLGPLIWKFGEHEKAEDMLIEAQQIAELLGEKKTLANILYNRGEINYYKEFYMLQNIKGKELELHQKALKIREEIEDHKGITHSLSRIGVIYERMDNIKRAMDYYKRAIELGEKINYKRGTGRPLTHIGAYYYENGDFKKGLEYFQKSLAIDIESGDRYSLVWSFANVAVAIYKVNGDFDTAMKYCQRALNIAENIGFKMAIARTLYVIGTLYQEERQNDKALAYFNKTVETAKNHGDKIFVELVKKKIQETEKN